MLSEKMQGKEATVSTEPIDKLAKKLASKNAAQLMNELKNNSHVYPVPSKTFSKQFFESFPSCYRWKSDFLDVDRESLVIATGWSEEDSLPERVQYTLNLIQFEIFHKRFTKAFEIISNPVTKMLIQSATSSVSIAESSPEIRSQMLANLSTYHELLGSFEQIVCQLGNAEVEFRIALELNPDNFDAKLKLIMLLAEFGEYEQAEAQYGMWLLSLSSGISVDALDGGTETIKPVTTTGADLVIKAWILTHRAGLWTSRGSDGLYRPDTITKAITDIDAARALVGTLMCICSLLSYCYC